MRALLAALVVLPLLAGCVADPPLQGAAVEPDATVTAPLAEFAPAMQLRALVEAAVASGEPVQLLAAPENDALGRGLLGAPRAFEVVLQPSAVLNESTWAEVDGERVPFPDVKAYEGHVEDAPDRLVRLTVTPEWARGTVRVGDVQYLIRVGLHGNLPYYAPDTELEGARAVHASAGWSPLQMPMTYDRNGQEPEDCLRPVPMDVTPMVEPLGGATKASALTARLVMDGDAYYAHQLGPHALPMLVAFANEVDAIYQHEVGIRFALVGLHLNTDVEYYPDPEEEAPLGKLAEYWNARPDVKRDAVHVVTGQTSSYAQANCIGGVGYPDTGYTFTPLNWERQYVVFHGQAFAHELGHIFSAHHHYGNHVESNGGTGLATIMIQGYTPGAKPVFGSLEKSVIRGYAENHLGKHDE